MKVKSESEVAQSFPTLCDPMDCSLPGSSVHGIFQARVLGWGAMPSLKQSAVVIIVLSCHRCSTFLVVLSFRSVSSNEQENLLYRRAGSEQEMVSLK